MRQSMFVTAAALALQLLPGSRTSAQASPTSEIAASARGLSVMGYPALLAPSDLKVRIVIETSPGVYVPVIAPAGTVVSANGATSTPPTIPTPATIINCPTAAGVATITTTDCSEGGLATTSSIFLKATPAGVPNAYFYKWTDIPPGTTATTISNGCIYSSYLPPPGPTLLCKMTGSRYIQAVYKCSAPTAADPTPIVYDEASKQCKKGGATPSKCISYMPNRTNCILGLHINRGKVGSNTITLAVLPSALVPTVNAAPSSSASCINAGNTVLQTHCVYYYAAVSTSVTVTATSSSGSLPAGFGWTGPCLGSSGGSSSTCVVTVTQSLTQVGANFP